MQIAGKNMKKIIKVIAILILVIILAAAALIGVLSATEYKPAETETVELTGEGSKTLAAGESFGMLTWNTGYAGLSKTADFFMDGGKGVRTQDKTSVQNNIAAFEKFLAEEDADIVFLQETDRNSARSYGTDQYEQIGGSLAGMQRCFANNFKVLFIPYPIPPIGKVDSGIATYSRFASTEAVRVKLPNPFSWPIRMANLKRCLLVTRIPVEDTGKELVLVNLHLEAYDEGEGKIAQTKMLAELMQSEYDKGNYVIAAGDFNQSFSGTDTSMYPLQSGDLWQCGLLDEQQFPDGWQFLMDTAHPTCRSLDRAYDPQDETFQYYMIDGYIVSDNVEVESVETVDLGFENSDHNPVRLKARLKAS